MPSAIVGGPQPTPLHPSIARSRQATEAEVRNIATLDIQDQSTEPDRVGIWLLAAHHLSSTWGDRSAEFAFPIYLMELFVDTILPASVYGFVTTAAGILLSGTIGHQVDIRPRLPTIRTCIATQKLFASVCYALFLILFGRFPALDPAIRRLMLSIITLSGCGLKLATVGMNVCVERDWVMTIVTTRRTTTDTATASESLSPVTQTQQIDEVDRILLQLNATLRRIDLICKLLAPLFVSLLTSTVGYMISAAVLLAIGLVTMVFECIFVGVVYKKFPALAVPRPIIEVARDTDRSALGVIRCVKAWGVRQTRDWVEFVNHPIFLSSLSISLLYFNVLSFNSPFISYLKSQTGFSDPLIAGMRGLCVATGLFGTFMTPWLERRIGSEAFCLAPTVLCLYVGTDQRHRPTWNAVLLFSGMALSRIGLWSFDLAQLTQLQKAVAHHPHQNTLAALQFSLQNIFDLAHYGLTLGWNRPAEFKYAATVSIGAVFIAGLVYVVGYARPLRGHLFYFDRLCSRLATAAR